MTGLEPALITGGASLLGGILSNRANAKQAQAQMNFQERMSSTAHQREVQDLRAAGLNPILSANKGASTPSGAAADIKDVLSPAVASAQAARRLDADLDNMAETNKNIAQDTKKKQAETEFIGYQANSAEKTAEIEQLKLMLLRKGMDLGKEALEKLKKYFGEDEILDQKENKENIKKQLQLLEDDRKKAIQKQSPYAPYTPYQNKSTREKRQEKSKTWLQQPTPNPRY